VPKQSVATRRVVKTSLQIKFRESPFYFCLYLKAFTELKPHPLILELDLYKPCVNVVLVAELQSVYFKDIFLDCSCITDLTANYYSLSKKLKIYNL
jgi:hypothetical protein